MTRRWLVLGGLIALAVAAAVLTQGAQAQTPGALRSGDIVLRGGWLFDATGGAGNQAGSETTHPASYVASQRQNDNDDEKHAHQSSWAIAPTATIGPSRQCTDQQQDKDYNQNSGKHLPSPVR